MPASRSGTDTAARETSPGPQGKVILVSPAQVAETLGCSRRHAYKLLDSGAIESKYLGRRRLVSWTSLCEFMDNLPTFRD